MAKDKETKTEKSEKSAAAPEFKYGVSDLADILGTKPASVRVQLRSKGIDKAGKSYGWNTKTELEAVATQLKTASKEAAEKAPKAEKKTATKVAPKAKVAVKKVVKKAA